MATTTTSSTAHPSADDGFSSSGTTRSDHLKPVDISKEPIILGDNPAHVEGVLYEVGRFYSRKGLFQPLFKDRAVLLSNGKLAIDSPQALVFINQTVTDPHSFDDPCPPTNTRISNFDKRAIDAGTPAFVRINTIRTPDPIKEQLKDQFVIQPYAVEREDNLLFSSLIQIFESADKATEMEEAAGGSGIELLQIIRRWGSTAKPKDRALVTEERNAVVKAGIEGELNLDSFNSYYRKFRRAERFVPPGARLSDETVIQQLQNLMFRDPSVRDLWELTESVSSMSGRGSSTADELVSIIREMLRSRKVSHAIDNVTRGVQSSFTNTADPKKGGKKPTNPKQRTFPEARDSSGKLTKWVTGMAPCGCGGLHLFRDCPNQSASSGTSKQSQPNQSKPTSSNKSKGTNPPTSTGANNTSLVAEIDGATDLGEDDLPDELLSFFAFASDPTPQPHLSESLVSAGSSQFAESRDQPPLAQLMPDHELCPPTAPARVTYASHGQVYTFDRRYSLGETLHFYSINVGSSPGVYYGTWSDVAPLIHGKSAPPGVTTHKRFKEEWQAHQHQEHSLEFQALGGRPISMGLTAAERMGLRDEALAARQRALQLETQLESSSAPAEQPSPPEAAIAPTAAESAPDSELPSFSPSPNTVPDHPTTPDRYLTRSDLVEVRQTLKIKNHLALQIILMVGVAIASFCIGAAIMSLPPTQPDQVPLSLPEPLRLPLLRGEFDGVEPPIPTSSGYSKRGSAAVFFGCILVSLMVTTEFRSIGWATFNAPTEVFKLLLLWALTPIFAVSSRAFRCYERFSPLRLRFAELVSSVNRLKPILAIVTALLVICSTVCFCSSSIPSRLFTGLRPGCASPETYCDVEASASLHHHSLISGGKARPSSSSPLIKAVVDSGATAGSTDDVTRLINLRHCDEVFGDAGGRVASCECVGTLPVGVRDRHGNLVRINFTNIRYVPSFKYTLLSVTQMWREQRFEARFGDYSCLEIHGRLDRDNRPVCLPFAEGEKLPTLMMLSLTDPTVLAKTGGRVALASSFSQSGLGFHHPRSTSHIGRLSGPHAGELMHRCYHCGVDKIRAIASTSADGTPNLASAPKWTCEHCAGVYTRKASHSGHLAPPPPIPGKLHVDIKGPFSRSIGGYLYAALFIDEFSRMIFFEPLKTKADIVEATKRVVSKFEATVGVPVDESGVPSERPRVFEIRSDHEGGLISGHFESFRLEKGIHSSLSPPHDHDLNPIAEATIRSVDRLAVALRIQSGASVGFWPYIIRHAVDIHNSTKRPCGSSPADILLTPYQRFALKPPNVLDLVSFGCRAVIAKPPPSIRKGDLSSRGWVGCFLGRSSQSVGAYDVWVPELQKVVTSSSVLVDEEHFPWRGKDAKQTLSPPAASAPPAVVSVLPSPSSSPPSDVPIVSSPSDVAAPPSVSLSLLSLFSGAYVRVNGLAEQLKIRGWANVVQVDHDPISGGGWRDDLLNDEAYSNLLRRAASGEFHGIMIALDCSTFSVARFYRASNGADSGPPPVRTKEHPDGLPSHLLDPKHAVELRKANKLLERCVDIAIAARSSPVRSTVIFENPADRSVEGTAPYCADLANHGSVFATSDFARLARSVVPNEQCTFAQCRLGSDAQKYTTLFYSIEAASVLRQLNESRFQCNHETAHASVAGGRDESGNWKSARFSSYPSALNSLLAEAFTRARVGAGSVVFPPSGVPVKEGAVSGSPSPAIATPGGEAVSYPVSSPRPSTGASGRSTSSPALSPFSVESRSADAVPDVRPISFPSLDDIDLDSATAPLAAPSAPAWRTRGVRDSTRDGTTSSHERKAAYERRLDEYRKARASKLNPIAEAYSPSTPEAHENEFADEAYEPMVIPTTLVASPDSPSLRASALENGACSLAVDVYEVDTVGVDRFPLTGWMSLQSAKSFHAALLSSVCDSVSLRADSAGAPETHKQAVEMGQAWMDAEHKELSNHRNNQSWVRIRRDELPAGRRLHKLVWVYKVKRDGTSKARLCVQGCTLEPGVDYDQTFSQTLRHSSARSLFALAARLGCSVRSIDYVAAYLQGEFVEGEVVYCYMPSGYEEKDTDGVPFIVRVEKPIYGIPQAGRRLQRKAFPWFKEQGLQQCGSDECVFVWRPNDASSEVFAVGVYVDNLQIVHSAPIDSNGNALDADSFLARFLANLRRDWDVVDEGVMEDLLAIQVRYNDDGSITLHQAKYIDKLAAKYQPKSVDASVQRASLPYSADVVQCVLDAVDADSPAYPHLVKDYQERIGALMYLTTSTRPDIAYVTHLLARAASKPTPRLLLETDRVIAYLRRNRDIGLTYVARELSDLEAYSDASWEVKNSTSGWVIMWQGAAISWGSSKQSCVALSSCEAEIVALSESCKDVVYLRKVIQDITSCAHAVPTPLYTDNQGARDLSYNPEHHKRTKHVERRHFFVRDMVEKMELTVPFVAGEHNLADFLTKPLSAKRFANLRRLVMNEQPQA